MKLTQEIIEKAKAAKSAEELLSIAKENGINMTADEAQTYFEQINANSLDDDLLEGVAGGWIIFASEESDSSNEESESSNQESEPSTQKYNRGTHRKGQCR